MASFRLLAALPPSLLVEHVFTKLNKRDIYSVTETCRALLRLVEEVVHLLGAWSSVRFPGGQCLKRKTCDVPAMDSCMSLITRRASMIERLTITSFRATIHDLELASQCTRLRYLDIRSLHPIENLTADVMEHLSDQCPNVVTLGIPPSAFVRRTTKLLFPNIKKLIVCGGSSSQIQSYFTFPFETLDELELIDFDMSHGILISLCKNLSSLTLVRCWRNGEWREGDHPFHPDDPMFANVLHKLKHFTFCGSESAFCVNAVLTSIFVQQQWTALETLTMDSMSYSYTECAVEPLDIADYVCIHCELAEADPSVLSYNRYYKDKTLSLKYIRCDACRARNPAWLRSVTILWW